MVIMVKLTPDGRAWSKLTTRGARVYNGMALGTPEHWERNHYTLTMTMLDTFEAADKPNKMATNVNRNMRSGAYMPDVTIYGTVYITNETANEIVDFAMHDFMYMYNQICKPIYTN